MISSPAPLHQIRVPGCAFQSNAHVGALVRHVVESTLHATHAPAAAAAARAPSPAPAPDDAEDVAVAPHRSVSQGDDRPPSAQAGQSSVASDAPEGPSPTHGQSSVASIAPQPAPGPSAQSPPLHWLQVVKEGGEGAALLVDLGVYSRNRTFRLYLSSKAGKTARLVPTARFAGPGFLDPADWDRPVRECFDRSLICGADTVKEVRRFGHETAPSLLFPYLKAIALS